MAGRNPTSGRRPNRSTMRADGKTNQKVFGGHVYDKPPPEKKLKFREQAWRLLETINNPRTTDALRRTAKKTLEERISERKGYLTTRVNELLKLQGKRPLKAYEEHDLKINEKGLAEVELVKALSEGEKNTSQRVKWLTKRILKLKKEVGEMQKRMNR